MALATDDPPALAVLTFRASGPGAAGASIEGLRVLDLTRARAALVLRRGLEHHARGEYQRSRALFRKARDTDPHLAEASYDLACAEARLGETEAALRALGRAFELSPDRLRAVAEEDPDLATLRHEPVFRSLLGRKAPPP